ncbi:MAG TPA: hypothetical protein VJG32_00725 [Anaerolineae bacterium]|nr:hypothetical protein [Anaerolineae bacterium]
MIKQKAKRAGPQLGETYKSMPKAEINPRGEFHVENCSIIPVE